MLEKKLLTPQQVADNLQINFRTVYTLIRSGELKAVKVGRVWRITPEAVEEFISKNSSGN